jgi:hypothetical protein
MTNGIQKGKAGERELLNLLQGAINEVYLRRGYQPPELKRSGYTQSDGGGCDVMGLDWLAIEVKRCERLELADWWIQAKKQAKHGQIPVLIYRQSRKPWRVRMCGLLQVCNARALRMLADINISTFLAWLKMRCEADLDAFEQPPRPMHKGQA